MTVAVSGACMAVRKSLFVEMEGHYGDDCVIPLDVLLQGYRVVVEPMARAYVENVRSPRAELRARARMTLRNLTGTLSRWRLLNPIRHPLLSLAIVSHKLLRWLTPYLLVACFVSNAVLAGRPLYRVTLLVQMAFYGLAVLGMLLAKRGVRVSMTSAPFGFCVAQLGIMMGVAKAILGARVVRYKNR